MKYFRHWLLISIALVGLVVTNNLYTQAQQTAQGEIQLEVTAGNSCCVYGTSVVFGEKDVNFGIIEFTGDFLSYHGTTTWGCRDLLGTETGRVMYISMSGDMESQNGNKISSGNVKISYDQTSLVGGNCEYVSNSGVDSPLSSAVKLVEKTNIPTNYGKICELGTTNVKLKVVTNTGQAPGNYVGTLVIDLPNFVSSTCDGLLEGTFYDAETDGLTYIGNMGSAGITANSGTFTYKPGEEITFKIGNVTLGNPVIPAANGSVFVTDLFGLPRTEITDPSVIKIATLLQGLDADNNPENGITIPGILAAAFTESGNLTGLDVYTKLTNLSLPIRDVEEVVQHLENTAVNKLQENPHIQYGFIKYGSGSSVGQMSASITTDKEGYSYIAGNFNKDIVLGSTVLTGNGENDIFVAKIDRNGVWSQIIQSKTNNSDDYVTVHAIALDQLGNKYIAGIISGSAIFGNIEMNENGVFIAKINQNGNRERGKYINTWGNVYYPDLVSSMVVDNMTNIYLIGRRGQTIVIDKLNQTGVLVREKVIPSNKNNFYSDQYGIDRDAMGNIYIAASFGYGEPITLGSTTLIKEFDGSCPHDIFVGKINNNGNWLRVKQSYGCNNEAYGIKVDENGNSYVMGTISSSENGIMMFGTGVLTGGVFVTKLDTDGNIQRLKGLNQGFDPSGISYENNNIYVLGRFFDNITIGNSILTGSGIENFFVAKLDNNGNQLNGYKVLGIGLRVEQGRNALSVYKGNISLVGYSSSIVNIKDKYGTTVESLGHSNFIFRRINPRNQNYYLEPYFRH